MVRAFIAVLVPRMAGIARCVRDIMCRSRRLVMLVASRVGSAWSMRAGMGMGPDDIRENQRKHSHD